MKMLSKYYKDTFTISRPTSVKTNGVMKTTYTDTSGHMGRIDPLKTLLQYQSGSEQVVISHKLFTSSSVDIRELDIVTLSGKKYNVIQVINPFGKSHHIEVLLDSRY